MFELEHVSVRHQDRVVLDDVSLTLAERRVAVIGANGSGKSTLARLLNGLHTPSAGRVRAFGIDTREDARAVLRRVGFVFQDPDAQIVYPTVAEDVAFGLRARRVPKAAIGPRVDAALAAQGLSELRDHPAHVLSGGEKQLLALASVLVLAPDAIVMDEPTTLLDLRNARRVVAAIDALPIPVVIITHDLELAGRADRVVVLDAGHVVHDGPPDAAIAAYRELLG